MNAAHIHLLLNHVPVLATVFATVLFLWGMWKNNTTVIKTALVGFIVAAIFAIPVLLSGHAAEDVVEHLPGVTESFIDAHEEAAELTFWLSEVLGVASLVLLFLAHKKGQIHRGALIVLCIVSLIVSGCFLYTANVGGQVRHTEIRSGAIVPAEQENGHK